MIYRILIQLGVLLLASACSSSTTDPPTFMIGSFQDDYSIEYEISDDLWIQKPTAKYHIELWNSQEQYLIAQNDSLNPSDAGLYTRIDWVEFDNMLPYEWGFCMTAYRLETMDEAINISPPDRKNPKTGCNGHPFSRMQTRPL